MMSRSFEFLRQCDGREHDTSDSDHLEDGFVEDNPTRALLESILLILTPPILLIAWRENMRVFLFAFAKFAYKSSFA